METLSIVKQRKQRWTRFLDADPRGPRRMILVRYEPDNQPRPWPRPDNVPQRIDWAWEQYQRQLDRCRWLDDDTVPRLYPYTGTELFAEAFGCRVHQPDNDMPFACPLIHSSAEVADLPEPTLEAAPLKRVFDIADELFRRAQAGAGARASASAGAGEQDDGGAVMQLVDIQSPMDIAALVWDKNDLFLAMLESPDAVRQLAARAARLLTRFLDEWFARYGRGFVAHFPDYYMPRGVTLSEDEIGIVSPEMFDELFLPELTALSNRYGGLGMHCCAESRHQWSNFLKIPNLRLLNLVRPPEQAREALSFFADHTAQMHSLTWDEAQIRWLMENAPQARVVFEVNASSADEARRIVDRFRRLDAQ